MKIPQTDIWLVLPCVHLVRPLISVFYLDSFIVLFDFMSIESQLGVLRIGTLPCPFTGTEFILEPQPSSWTSVTSGVHTLYLPVCMSETSNSIFFFKNFISLFLKFLRLRANAPVPHCDSFLKICCVGSRCSGYQQWDIRTLKRTACEVVGLLFGAHHIWKAFR